jgi:extracellular factor (EF) 3-hydroxypalmitic acid methyl ester biosynthesis protein
MNLGPLMATAHHADLGSIAGSVQDVSFHGLALRVPGATARAEAVLGGDRLDELVLAHGEGVIYRGSAIIRRVSDQGGDLVLGVEFENSGLDLAEVYRRGARQSFGERWKGLIASNDNEVVSPAFKAWVMDLRTDLERIRDFLAAEEQALASADEVTRRETLAQYLSEVLPRILERLNRAAAEIRDLVMDTPEDVQPIWRAFCRRQLGHLFAASPFMKRATDKPLGYAGDYEMMNMLYRDHAEGSSLFGKAVNVYATQEAAARANINRIDLLVDLIREAATRAVGRVRIASVGCGPAKEIAAVLERYPEVAAKLDVALIDQEDRSIAYCERTLTPLANRTGARVQFIRESIRRLLVAKELSEALGARELIYSAGLFDYLNERSFSALLSTLYSTLVPDGLLAVGNVAVDNPSRQAMEYFSDWFLIHRSADDLLSLGSNLSPAPASINVGSELLGVNLFLFVRR